MPETLQLAPEIMIDKLRAETAVRAAINKVKDQTGVTKLFLDKLEIDITNVNLAQDAGVIRLCFRLNERVDGGPGKGGIIPHGPTKIMGKPLFDAFNEHGLPAFVRERQTGSEFELVLSIAVFQLMTEISTDTYSAFLPDLANVASEQAELQGLLAEIKGEK